MSCDRHPGYSFTVPGHPVPWGRTRNGRGNARITPPEVRQHKLTVQQASLAVLRGRPTFPAPTPVELVVIALVRRPKRTQLGEFPAKVPDVDNYAKLVSDALNGMAYDDDAQVVSVIGRKRWSPDGVERTRVQLREVCPECAG